MNRLDFQQLAEERLADAEILLAAARFDCAYYLAGYAVAGASWLTFGEGVVYRWNGDALAVDLSCELG